MKTIKYSFLFILVLLSVSAFSQKITGVDSTGYVIDKWIKIVSEKNYSDSICMHGVNRPDYDNNLRAITNMLDDYKKGNYASAYKQSREIRYVKFSEIRRIKFFMMTMSEIGANKRFKAKKWYYYSKQKMDIRSFIALQKNVSDLHLSYKIDNYRSVRNARLTALFIGAGILLISPALSE